MNEPKELPTITQLWAKLQKALPHGPFFAANPPRFDDPEFQQFALGVVGVLGSLRQQLSDIAKTVPDSGGQSSIFAIDGGTLLIENTVDRLRHDNAETLAEFTAACGFWLSELQQRQVEKEAKGE